MQVEQFLEASAGRLGNKTALVAGSRRLTYREIDDHCNLLARALMAEGVERWDRVAIFLENSVEAVLSVFAVLKAGGVFVIINPTTKPEKLKFVLNNCRATVLITHAERLDSLEDCVLGAPTVKAVVVAGKRDQGIQFGGKRTVWIDDILQGAAVPFVPLVKRCIDIDLAALIYTSGSTGRPKGVMLTHLNILAASSSITEYLESTEDDIVLNVLPFSFDYGLYQLLMTFKVGGHWFSNDPSSTQPKSWASLKKRKSQGSPSYRRFHRSSCKWTLQSGTCRA